MAERYFGFLPPPAADAKPSQPPVPLPLPKLDKVIRETIEDQVEMTKIIIAFHSPAHFEPGDAELDIFASVLSSGKTSRLYKSLVYEKALAQSVSATQESSVLSSIFTVEIMVRPGGLARCRREGGRRRARRSDHQGAHRRRTQAGQEPHRVRLRRTTCMIAARARLLTCTGPRRVIRATSHRPRSLR